jgi:hypothetical protein
MINNLVKYFNQDGTPTDEGIKYFRAQERRPSGGGGGPVAWGDVTGKPSAFPPTSHGHIIADVTGLQTALDGKQAAGSYAAATHGHIIADVTGLQTALDGKAAATHSHIIADVTGLQTALDGKAAATHGHALADLTASGASAGQIAMWDGSAWVPQTPLRIGTTLMTPAAGEFIGNGMNATALGTQAQVANRTVIAPFVSAYDVTIDQLGVSVSTFVASATVKCVIYAADSQGRPTTILRETATIDAGSNGTRFATITSLALTAGTKYWIGIRSSSTATLRTLGVGSAPALTYTNAATPEIESALILTETYANAAANWTYAASQHSNALVPLVLMRVA